MVLGGIVFRRNCLIVLLAFAPLCEADSQGKKQVATALANVRSGRFSPSDTYQLAQGHVIEAIPALREQFEAKTEPKLRSSVASALVRLRVPDKRYWDYLVEQATKAIKNDAPSLFLVDSKGRIQKGFGKLAPAFEAWAMAKGIELAEAAQEQLYVLPSHITFLGITGDMRGRALLRKALSSKNYLIQSAAAKGLARLKDTESIPAIIEVCQNAPVEAGALIAGALVFFDDRRAQEAAERFITNKQILESLRKRARSPDADPFVGLALRPSARPPGPSVMPAA